MGNASLFVTLSLKPAAEAGVKSVICTPIKNADGTVIAVGQLVNKSIGVFTISDIQAFEVRLFILTSVHMDC